MCSACAKASTAPSDGTGTGVVGAGRAGAGVVLEDEERARRDGPGTADAGRGGGESGAAGREEGLGLLEVPETVVGVVVTAEMLVGLGDGGVDGWRSDVRRREADLGGEGTASSTLTSTMRSAFLFRPDAGSDGGGATEGIRLVLAAIVAALVDLTCVGEAADVASLVVETTTLCFPCSSATTFCSAACASSASCILATCSLTSMSSVLCLVDDSATDALLDGASLLRSSSSNSRACCASSSRRAAACFLSSLARASETENGLAVSRSLAVLIRGAPTAGDSDLAEFWSDPRESLFFACVASDFLALFGFFPSGSRLGSYMTGPSVVMTGVGGLESRDGRERSGVGPGAGSVGLVSEDGG